MQFDIYQNMELGQQSLFNVYDYVEKPVEDGKTGVKRGPYNKHKLRDINSWEVMSQCYRELGNYCPVPLFNAESSVLENNGLRLWCEVYTSELYSYFDKEYLGEDFKILEAEIIGTESMPIEWRLFLHLTLLDFLKDGFNLNDIMPYIYRLIELNKKGLALKDLFVYLWTMEVSDAPME